MLEALIRTANRLQGSYALGVICAEEPGKIYAVREASPLILGIGIGENFFASDVTALVNHTRSVIYLEDGEFAELTGESIRIFDYSGREIQKKASRVLWDVQAAEKGDRHLAFMSLESLNEMLNDIGSEVDIGTYDVLSVYDPEDLQKTAEGFDKILRQYLGEYEKAGMQPSRYADVDAFVSAYLK